MKIYSKLKYCLALLAVMASAACNDDIVTHEGGIDREAAEVRLSVGIQKMTPEYARNSRSAYPMSPEQENPMKSLAVIQFDSEGNMLRINKENQSHQHFHYIDLTSENNPAGQITANIDVKLIAARNTRVCLVANMTEDAIMKLTWNAEQNRTNLWTEFRLKTVDIPYILNGEKVGHVEQVYMYGAFEGDLNTNTEGKPVNLSISMARLISRLEMNIKKEKGMVIPSQYRFFLGFTCVEDEAYLVPGAAKYIETLVHDHVAIMPNERTDIIQSLGDGEAAVFYFYMAPHIVKDIKNITKFVIWCVDATDDDLARQPLLVDLHNNGHMEINQHYDGKYASINMCNDPLLENPNVNGAMWLNRNSLYHVNITLQNKGTRSAGVAVLPGEYVIDIADMID